MSVWLSHTPGNRRPSVTHASAYLTPRGRLVLSKLVVNDGWSTSTSATRANPRRWRSPKTRPPRPSRIRSGMGDVYLHHAVDDHSRLGIRISSSTNARTPSPGSGPAPTPSSPLTKSPSNVSGLETDPATGQRISLQ